jgi:hypothetical protein
MLKTFGDDQSRHCRSEVTFEIDIGIVSREKDLHHLTIRELELQLVPAAYRVAPSA